MTHCNASMDLSSHFQEYRRPVSQAKIIFVKAPEIERFGCFLLMFGRCLVDFWSIFGRIFDQNWVLRGSWEGSGRVLGACWRLLGSWRDLGWV